MTGREVALGEPVLTLRPLAGEARRRSAPRRRASRCGGGSGSASRTACMPGRRRWSRRRPASFAAEIALEIGGRRANARSPVAVMALGVRARRRGRRSSPRGADAGAALEALAALVGGRARTRRRRRSCAVRPAAAPPEPTSPLGSLRRRAGRAGPGHRRGGAADRAGGRGRSKSPARRTTSARRWPRRWQAVGAALTGAAGGRARPAPRDRRGAPGLPGRPGAAARPQAARSRRARSAGVGLARAPSAGYVDQLRGGGDARMMERAADLADLERQVLLQLSGEAAPAAARCPTTPSSSPTTSCPRS